MLHQNSLASIQLYHCMDKTVMQSLDIICEKQMKIHGWFYLDQVVGFLFLNWGTLSLELQKSYIYNTTLLILQLVGFFDGAVL